jgi:hypothetical protein
MSLTVATCHCGRRYYRFDKTEWDSTHTLAWCPACDTYIGGRRLSAVEGWPELAEARR